MTTTKDPTSTTTRLSLVAMLFVFFIQHSAFANILTVTSAADDGGANTLRSIVAASPPGGTIVFADALKGLTISLVSSEIVIDKNLTISGPPDASITVIGGNTVSPLNKRIFHVTSPAPDPTRTFQVSGLQMQGSIVAANGANGTAISPNGGNGANPAGNVTDHGGGGAIYSETRTLLVVSNCYFFNCQARGGNGGDAYSASCSSNAIGGVGGSAGGGAIFSFGDCFLYHCSFYTNTAVGGIGGTGAQGGSGGTGGDGIGGAIAIGYLDGADLRVINCTFYDNIAYGGDGGQGGTRIFCTVETTNGGTGGTGGNGKGGAIFNHQSVVPPSGIVHSTVYNNYCYRGGGGGGGTGINGGLNGAIGGVGGAFGCGLFVAQAPVRAGNNLFAGNHALPTTAVPSGPDVHGSLATQGHNLVATDDGTCLFAMPDATDILGTVALPINPLLGPFQNHGGFIPTIVPQQGSPAIDAGTAVGLPFDAIGQTRPVVVSGIVNGGDGSDIGAFEVQCGTVRPLLQIAKLLNNVIVTWPSPSYCFKLQTSPDMMNWTDYAGSVDVVGGMNQVVVAAQPNKMFYRLVSP